MGKEKIRVFVRTLIISALAIACLDSISNGQSVIDGPIQSPVNGHYYSVLSNSNWTDAEAASQALGGYLATVRSAAEETWIQQTFSAYPYLWIGLYDPTQQVVAGQAHANNFVWVDGETSAYRDWAGGEPNNFNGDEYWTELVLTNSSTDPSGTWNDIYNDPDPTHPPNFYGPVYGLVEVVPEPTSLGLLALTIPLLCRRNRNPWFCTKTQKKFDWCFVTPMDA